MSKAEQKAIALLVDRKLYYSTQAALGIRQFFDHLQGGPPLRVVRSMELGTQARAGRLGTLAGAVGFAHDEDVEYLRACRLPLVSVRTSGPPAPHVVTPDHRLAGQMGGDHLIQQGHRRLAFLRFESMTCWRRRVEGFLSAAEKAGVQARELTWRGAMDEALRQELKDVTAVMMPTDEEAGRLTSEASRYGLRVPDDLAVLGADNDIFACELAEVPLSSVDLNPRRIGLKAAEMLWRLLDGEVIPQQTLVPPLRVVTRQSTSPLAFEDPHIRKTMAFIRQHATEGIGVEDVMEILTISRRSLEMRFKRRVGRTLLQQIRHCRFEKAKRLLTDTSLTVTEIAHRCGYAEHSRFTNHFRKHVGLPPSAYRAEHIDS